MNNIRDQLSWTEFELHSKKASRPIKKISEFNRLIAHSENFFLISGYGAFTDGYVLIISKDFIPSYGLVEKDKINEITFLIDLILVTSLKTLKILNALKIERPTDDGIKEIVIIKKSKLFHPFLKKLFL